MMVSQRRKLLDYLKRTDAECYRKLLVQLDIRR
jgi:ribosomal protein S15P/S13E